MRTALPAVAAVVSVQQTRAAHRTISQLPHGVRRRASVLRVCLEFGADVALARSEFLLRTLSCVRAWSARHASGKGAASL